MIGKEEGKGTNNQKEIKKAQIIGQKERANNWKEKLVSTCSVCVNLQFCSRCCGDDTVNPF